MKALSRFSIIALLRHDSHHYHGASALFPTRAKQLPPGRPPMAIANACDGGDPRCFRELSRGFSEGESESMPVGGTLKPIPSLKDRQSTASTALPCDVQPCHTALAPANIGDLAGYLAVTTLELDEWGCLSLLPESHRLRRRDKCSPTCTLNSGVSALGFETSFSLSTFNNTHTVVAFVVLLFVCAFRSSCRSRSVYHSPHQSSAL